MQNTQAQEYNVKAYIDDPEESLEELFDHFDHFAENLQDFTINPDYLPTNVILIKHNNVSNHNKFTEDVMYLVLLNTDYHEWVQQFGTYQTVTSQSYSDKKPRSNQKESKKCDCKSQIIITIKKTFSESKMLIKYVSHTNHISGSDSDIGKHNEQDIGMLFGFTIPTRKKVLCDALIILLDATHGMNKHKDLLYTLLAPDPKTGKGITLAHLLSLHKSFKSVQYWLSKLNDQIPNLQGLVAFMHVSRAWRDNLKKVYKEKKNTKGNKIKLAEKRALEEELFADLKYIMHVDDINTAKDHLADIRAEQMMPAERETHLRKVKVQALTNTVIKVNNSKCCWTVASKTKPEIRYSIVKNLEHDQFEQQLSCTCLDFKARYLPCKHIYAIIFHQFPSLNKNINSTY
ncbi:2453_t:CDS:2 [Cetraspora pellucida]|uniref:2453_t:CDS:1 n=1 Tax=Cetraspora pellucida TaxID=1433469 RepID=A0A9N9BCP9_9GLOM|nr:2453_t:CDS:2 [Cetraspora pellucida]